MRINTIIPTNYINIRNNKSKNNVSFGIKDNNRFRRPKKPNKQEELRKLEIQTLQAYQNYVNTKDIKDDFDRIIAAVNGANEFRDYMWMYDTACSALNRINAPHYRKDRLIIADFILAMRALGAKEGFNRISGYEDIKEQLMNEYILPIVAKSKTSQGAQLPNAYLFYGPTGCGKTLFAHALAEQSLSHVEAVPLELFDEEEIFQEVMRLAEKAKRYYEEELLKGNKVSTIIVINEFDGFAMQDSPIIDKLADFLKDCSEKYHCTIFATTNYPKSIDTRILSSDVISRKIPIYPPDKNTARDIIMNTLETCGVNNINSCENLLEVLFEDEKNMYSCAQIVHMIKTSMAEATKIENLTEWDLIDKVVIKDKGPSVIESDYQDFMDDIEYLSNF